jgi:outer membrane protein OmpA-like peptidoglycan-associated protein
VRPPFDISRLQTDSPPIQEADAAPIGADAELSAQGETDTRTTPVQMPATVELPRRDTRQSELRSELLEQLNRVIPVRDTPRGLVATVPDSAFDGSELDAAVAGPLARVAAIIRAHPDLRIDVEGNSDTSAYKAMSSQRAETVRQTFIAQDLPEGRVTAHGLGNTRLFGPNSTAEGREANRRVEIVISGDPIGDLPLWGFTPK